MNYRHAYHAGNFADVMKHMVLVALLDAMKQKATPFCYIETHAGSGRYALFIHNHDGHYKTYGPTDTSYGFASSLQSALLAAKKW